MEIQVVQITVLVADMDDSIRFYRDRLGLGLATKQLNDLHSRPSFSSHALRANRLEPTRAIGVNPCARRACALSSTLYKIPWRLPEGILLESCYPWSLRTSARNPDV